MVNMNLIGYKNNRDIFKNLIEKNLPKDIAIYIEPFGGLFGLYKIMTNKPPISIYNDINKVHYDIVSKEFPNIILHNEDYKEIIDRYDKLESFFYLDPPYFGNEHYYKNHTFLEKENHIELYNILKNLKGRFMLSYNDNIFILSLYKDFNIYHYEGNNIHHKNEIIITNYVL